MPKGRSRCLCEHLSKTVTLTSVAHIIDGRRSLSIQSIGLFFIVALLEVATSRGLPSVYVYFAIVKNRRDGRQRPSLAVYDGIVDGFDHSQYMLVFSIQCVDIDA